MKIGDSSVRTHSEKAAEASGKRARREGDLKLAAAQNQVTLTVLRGVTCRQ